MSRRRSGMAEHNEDFDDNHSNYYSREPYDSSYQNNHRSHSPPGYPGTGNQYPAYQQYPQYPPYPSYPPPKQSSGAMIVIIAIVMAMAIIIPIFLAGVLYVWTSDFGGGGSTGLSINANVVDRNSYWKIEIVSVSGGSLSLSDSKFQLFSNTGTSLFARTTANINPTSPVSSGDAAIYAFSSSTSPVYENETIGDGFTVDAASGLYPERWEGCYFAYVDSQNDNKINSGDAIWVFKDWNDDNTDDVTIGYSFEILDKENQEVFMKELRVYYIPDDNNGDGNFLSISANVNDRTSYWKIEIVSVSGGSLYSSDAKFQLFSRAGTSMFTRTTANINPTSPLTSGESAIYANPSSTSPVYENSTTGDGAVIDSASVAYPERWEGCYFAYIDSQYDNKINSGDSIWVFKDWNEDNTDDVTTGFTFKILDGKNKDVLRKEF
jgi:hypothetical protein